MELIGWLLRHKINKTSIREISKYIKKRYNRITQNNSIE